MEVHNHFQDINLYNSEMEINNKLYQLNKVGKIKIIDEHQLLINFVNKIIFILNNKILGLIYYNKLFNFELQIN